MKKQRWLVLLLVIVMVLSAGVLSACTPKTFTITFVADGVEVEKVQVEQGKAVTFPSVPDKEGFKGAWDITSIPTADKDQTVTAVYTAIVKYTITFVVDGETVDTVEVEEGKSVQFPAVPAKEGYTGVWDPASISSASKDQTVTAVYTPGSSATVSFDTHGGSEMDAVMVPVNGKLSLPANPTFTGFEFDGWYADRAFNFKFDASQSIAGDMILHAAWTKNDYKVTLPTEYKNIENYVTFYKDGDGKLIFSDSACTTAVEDITKIPYGTKVYVAVKKADGSDSAKYLFVYQDGELLEGTAGADDVAEYEVFEIEVLGDTVVTATTTYRVTVNLDNGEDEYYLEVVNGKIVMPEMPEKEGYTFDKWVDGTGTDAKDFVNDQLTAGKTLVAKWKKNTYTISATTELEDVELELSKTTADYQDIVGLRIRDRREGANLVPLLIEINGDYQIMGAGSAPADNPTDSNDRVFDIEITKNTTVKVTAQHRYTKYDIVGLPGASDKYTTYSDAEGNFLTDHLGVTGTTLLTTDEVTKDLAEGETIVFYILVEEGYSIALNSSTSYSNWKIEPAKATGADGIAAITGVDHNFPKIAEGGNMTNKFKVTVTVPAPQSAGQKYTVNLSGAFTLTANTYNITGMNANTPNYILGQGDFTTQSGKSYVNFYTDSRVLTTYKVGDTVNADNNYKEKVYFVLLDSTRNYKVYMNEELIFDTLTDEANYYYKDAAGNEYKAWKIDATGTDNIGLSDAFCDQKWTLEEYKNVSVKINGSDYEAATLADPADLTAGNAETNQRKVEIGDIWVAKISKNYVVKVNGEVLQGKTTGDNIIYKYEVRDDIQVELIQKYTVTVKLPSDRDKTVEVGEYTADVLYGDTVSVPVVPNDYTGFILVVKGQSTDKNRMLANVDGTYSFAAGKDVGTTKDVKTSTAHQDVTDIEIVVDIDYTDDYVVIVYDNADPSKNAYGPIDGIDDYLTDPEKEGYIFKGWYVVAYDDGNEEYADFDYDTVLEAGLGAEEGQYNIISAISGSLAKLDKVVAIYARIEPKVIINYGTDEADGTKEADDYYKVDVITVDGATIYKSDSNWIRYIDTMMDTGYALDFDKAVVLTLKRTVTSLIDGYAVKVMVQGKEIVPNENGQYVVELSKFEYELENDELMITVEYRPIATDTNKLALTSPELTPHEEDITPPANELPDAPWTPNFTRAFVLEKLSAQGAVVYYCTDASINGEFVFKTPYGASFYALYSNSNEPAPVEEIVAENTTITIGSVTAGYNVRIIEFMDAEGKVVGIYIFINDIA